MKEKILIFTATYNEAQNIGLFLNLIDKLDIEKDILIIDDNSPDGTAEKIREFTKNKKGQALNIAEIPFNKSTIVFLILKNILQNKDIDIGKELKSQGLSFNFETLPYFKSVNELKN